MNLPSRWTLPRATIFACLPWLAACGSTDTGADGASGAAGSSTAGAGGAASAAGAAGAGDSSKLVGSFLVKLTPASDLGDAATSLLGKVYDAPTPSEIVWETALTDGACALVTPRYPFCNTPCAGTGVCVEDDTCAAYPTAHSVGVVSVNGLQTTSGASFTLSPVKEAYQPLGDVTLSYPPFAEGDAVTFAAAGGDYAPFSLAAKGITPVVLSSAELGLKTGAPLTLTWTPGTLSEATIHVKLDISHHAGTKGKIECDLADTGSLTIGAPMITKLLDLGIAGYPTVIVTRHTIGSAVIAPGRVELELASVVEHSVGVDGLISCTADADCTGGETCNTDDQTCK